MHSLHLLQSPFALRLGWSLIHFLWQDLVIAAILEVLLAGVERKSASLRYLLCCLALVAMPVCFVTTFSLSNDGSSLVASQFVAGMVAPQDPVSRVASAAEQQWSFGIINLRKGIVLDELNQMMPKIVALWCLGLFCLTLRKLGGFLVLGQLQRRGQSRPETDLLELFHQACFRMGFDPQRVTLMVSSVIKVPMTIGWKCPVVFFPLTLLSGLSCAEVELLLAHELAHIRRFDYLVNVCQTVVETLFFYHPITWWISHRAREERENSCDDLVVARSQNPLTYAKVLYRLETVRLPGATLALAANGGSLLQRVQRLLIEEKPTGMALPLILALLGILAMISPLAAAIQAKSVSSSASTPRLTAAEAKKRGVAAMVNQYPVLVSEVDASKEGASYEVTLNHLIENELIVESFHAHGYIIPRSVIDSWVAERIKEDYHGDRAAFESSLAREGKTFKSLWEDKYRKVITQSMRYHFGKRAADEYYQHHLQELPPVTQINVTVLGFYRDAHTPPPATPDQDPAFLQAKAALENVKAGGDFMTLVNQQYKGGDPAGATSWMTTGRSGRFRDQDLQNLKKLAPGQVSDIIRVQEGECYIARLNAIHPGQIEDTPETKEQVETLYKKKRDELLKAWLQGLKDQAQIQIFAHS